MAELLGQDGWVVAAGGGAVLDPETCRRMRAAGPVVWLRAGIETIQRQIDSDPTTRARRPDLTPAGGTEEIQSLLAVREPLYRRTATCTVDVDGRTSDEIVETILAQLPRELRGPQERGPHGRGPQGRGPQERGPQEQGSAQ